MSKRSKWLAVLVAHGALACSGVARAELWPLPEAVRLARGHAPAAVDAGGALRSAEALGAGARVSSFGNPYLEVLGDRGAHTRDVRLTSLLYVPVEVTGQRGARIDEWSRMVELTRARSVDVGARVAAATVEAYGGVLVANARLNEATRAAGEAEAEVRAFRERTRQGDATAYETSVVEAEAARWTQARFAAEAALARATASLAELVGERPAPPYPDAAPPPIDPARLDAARLAMASPAVAALGRESSYWDAVRERATAERTSPLSFVLSASRGELGDAAFGGGLAFTFAVSRRNQGEIARADSERLRADALGGALQRALEHRARGLVEALATTFAGIADVERDGIPAAERAVALSRLTHESGKGELVRVVIARRDLAAAHARRLELVEVAWRAYAEGVALAGDLP